jgi:hypothetical protein
MKWAKQVQWSIYGSSCPRPIDPVLPKGRFWNELLTVFHNKGYAIGPGGDRRILLHQGKAKPAKSRQLQGGAPDVQSEDTAKKIQFDPLNPSDRQSEITA